MGHDDYTISNVLSVKADTCASACYASEYTVRGIMDTISELEKKPDVNPEVKSTLDLRGKTLYATFYKDGFKTSDKTLIPDIKDITVHNNHAVIVEFVDGTIEKAVLHPEDNFSLEQGISICITKKLVGGSAIYNKLMERALDIKKHSEEAKAKKEAEAAERKERLKKYAEKKAARKERKREEYINTQKEAYLRALAEFNAMHDDLEK